MCKSWVIFAYLLNSITQKWHKYKKSPKQTKTPNTKYNSICEMIWLYPLSSEKNQESFVIVWRHSYEDMQPFWGYTVILRLKSFILLTGKYRKYSSDCFSSFSRLGSEFFPGLSCEILHSNHEIQTTRKWISRRILSDLLFMTYSWHFTMSFREKVWDQVLAT